MKILFLDFETSDTVDKKGKRNPSPFLPDNFLVSFGWRTYGYDIESSGYRFFKPVDSSGDNGPSDLLQLLLDEADLLVAHNAKFELSWLLEVGFKYDGKVYCTMVGEYLLACGLPVNLDLDSCCERRGTVRKLGTLIDTYWKAGLGFHQMPIKVVEEYGIRDVDCLYEVYWAQQVLFQSEEYRSLIPTLEMSNEFLRCLVDMERNGIYIDYDALEQVREEYTNERDTLRRFLEENVRQVMGDTPVNLDSPEQLSWVIYSRRVKDKRGWARSFNIGTDPRGKSNKSPRLTSSAFVAAVKGGTTVLSKTSAKHCLACSGSGRVLGKFTKAGTEYKKQPACRDCGGMGYKLVDSGKTAGFKLSPTGPQDCTSGGFATDKGTLTNLIDRLKSSGKGDSESAKFLESYIRYSAIGTYLETFVEGIARGRGQDGILHTKLNQCITRTGRLSSSDPNFQNIPRSGTFPVKRVIRSRFQNGSIIEVDFSQLEFRVAVFLAQDKQGMQDIGDKVDVHAYTASVIGCSRQDAKPHTFKPLYGGTSGTEAEQRYYKAFKLKYPGIAEWQQGNIQMVLRTGGITVPTGRRYKFVGTRRTLGGYVVNSTQICNYPVQGVATADIVPVLTIELSNELKSQHLRSLLILNVHDNAIFDCYPGEEGAVIELIKRCFKALPDVLLRRYGVVLNVPLDGEIKIGPNWLEMKGI